MKRRFTILTAALALLVCLAIPMGMWGQTTHTIGWGTASGDAGTYTNFTTTSGSVQGIMSFSTAKNSSQTAPAYNSNASELRLYYASNGSGGSITITPVSGVTVTGVVMTTSTTPSVKYYVDGGTGNNVTASSNTYTISNISASTSLEIQNANTTNTQLRIKTIALTYTTGGSVPTTYTVTYAANGGTGTMTDSNSPYTAGATVTVMENAFTRDGFTFEKWNTAADGSGTDYDEDDTFTINANTTLYAQWTENTTPGGDEQWVLTSLADLTSTDVFVIVGGGYAMTNDNGTSSAPSTSAVTITDNKITSTVAANIKWNVSGNATNGYTFYPNGTNSTWLYCNTTSSSGNNNNIRVGTGNRKVFALNSSSYLVTKDDNSTRYLSIYNEEEWRGYLNTNNGAVAISFYKKVTSGVTPPSISANNVNIAYGDTNGSISYTINDAPTQAGSLSADINAGGTIANLQIGTITSSAVPFTCDANTESTARTATVTLTYTYGNNETVTKTVTITQAAVPVTYTTIPALFEAATNTATDVIITFGSWVISAVHNSNAYLTDNQGHGLIIYASDHGFQVNDVLTGTVSCKLQTYRGSAELTNLTSSTEGLNVVNNGTVSEQNIAINTLGGVNTGALLAYQGLTYNGTALVDGNNNTITPYSTLYSYTFEEGKTYNVKGIYLQYNSTKEILPRSASDIVEVTPVTSDKYVKVTSTTDLTSGQYLIVYEEGSVAFNGGLETLDAPSNTIEVVISNNEIVVNTTTAASEFTIDVTAGTIKSASGYYIGRTEDSNGMNINQETVYTNTISIDGDDNAIILASGGAYLRYNSNNGQKRFRYFKSDSYTGQKAVQLYKKVSVSTKHIGNWHDHGYYLISSPIGTVNPNNVTNMITPPDPNNNENNHNTYDLYSFNQAQALEWRNYRSNDDDGHFNLEVGKGYLYGNTSNGEDGVDLVFTGTAISGSTYEVTLTKVANPGPGLDFPDWNLVGNPFPVMAYITKPYYKMNEGGTEIISVTGNSVEAMEGIFVKANTNNEVMTFSTTAPAPGKSVALNLNDGNNLIDRAIVVFSESEQLPKFQLDRNSTKLYIPQDGQDYAVVCSEEMGAMPVNFKAEDNGTYTLNFSCKNVGFAYLHLIDNKTGNDVDLLQTPSYSFEAKTTDYESRFKLVFATGDNSNDNNFAFFSNGSFVINNEGNATLQVIDIMGRIVSSETINGCTNVNVNAAPGVYMLRLVNGTDVKVQKVVVK